jgi:hypothetical protein
MALFAWALAALLHYGLVEITHALDTIGVYAFIINVPFRLLNLPKS